MLPEYLKQKTALYFNAQEWEKIKTALSTIEFTQMPTTAGKLFLSLAERLQDAEKRIQSLTQQVESLKTKPEPKQVPPAGPIKENVPNTPAPTQKKSGWGLFDWL